MVLEICVDSLESAVIAARGGAERVELCSDLLEGGITPSAGLIQAVRAAIAIQLFVMIRPRGGDFYYTESELEVMEADVIEAKRLGADGVVLGVLCADGRIDIQRTEHLVRLAAPMPVTFHRAFDLTPDLEQACEDVVATGAHRILTSGGRQTARLGASQIGRLVKLAGTRIHVMAGSGITAENAAELIRISGVTEFHASLRKASKSSVRHRKSGISLEARKTSEFVRYELIEADVGALRKVLDSAGQVAVAGRLA